MKNILLPCGLETESNVCLVLGSVFALPLHLPWPVWSFWNALIACA